MKTVPLILAALVAVIIIGVGAQYLRTHSSHTAPAPETTATSSMPIAITATQFSCPNTSQGYPVKVPGALSAFTVFDGPPAEMASLAPTKNANGVDSWELAGKGASKEGYYVTCQYGGQYGDADQTVQFKLPASYAECVVMEKNNLACQ